MKKSDCAALNNATTASIFIYSAPTTSPSFKSANNDDNTVLSTGAIAGLTVMSVVVFGMIVFAVYYFNNKKTAPMVDMSWSPADRTTIVYESSLDYRSRSNEYTEYTNPIRDSRILHPIRLDM